MAFIHFTSGRVIQFEQFDRKELMSNLSEALRAAVPWSVFDGERIISINPFSVETIEDARDPYVP